VGRRVRRSDSNFAFCHGISLSRVLPVARAACRLDPHASKVMVRRARRILSGSISEPNAQLDAGDAEHRPPRRRRARSEEPTSSSMQPLSGNEEASAYSRPTRAMALLLVVEAVGSTTWPLHCAAMLDVRSSEPRSVKAWAPAGRRFSFGERWSVGSCIFRSSHARGGPPSGNPGRHATRRSATKQRPRRVRKKGHTCPNVPHQGAPGGSGRARPRPAAICLRRSRRSRCARQRYRPAARRRPASRGR
jgi:hypothetical protein